MMATTTKRECEGRYLVSNGEYVVSIVRNDEFIGPDKWIASAHWDRYLMTDPLPTKRMAVREASRMLDNKIMEELSYLVNSNAKRAAALGL